MSAVLQHSILFPVEAINISWFNHALIRFRLIVFIPGSMLQAMFSGRFDTKPGEDGSYFIDRDGTHFRYILNYLRTGQLIVPKDEIIREELLAEAEFYQRFTDPVVRSTPNISELVEGKSGHHKRQRQVVISSFA